MQKRKKQSEKTEYLFKGDSCLYILVVYYTLYDVLPLLLLPFVSLFVSFPYFSVMECTHRVT